MCAVGRKQRHRKICKEAYKFQKTIQKCLENINLNLDGDFGSAGYNLKKDKLRKTKFSEAYQNNFN